MVALGEFRAVDKPAYMKRDKSAPLVLTAANTPTNASSSAAVPVAAAAAAQSLRDVPDFSDDETDKLLAVELTHIHPTTTAAAVTATTASAISSKEAVSNSMRDMDWSSIEDILTWKNIRDYLVKHHMPLAYGNASWGFCCACVQAMITTFVIVLRQIVYGTTVWTFYAQWLVLYVCAISYIFSFSMLVAAVQIWLRQQSHVPLLKDKLFSAQHITQYTTSSGVNGRTNGCVNGSANCCATVSDTPHAVKLVAGADGTVKVAAADADDVCDSKEALVQLITAMISLVEQDDVAPQVRIVTTLLYITLLHNLCARSHMHTVCAASVMHCV
jgi:hypothetical protein